MLDRNVRYCPMCRGELEVRVRFVDASPRSTRPDRYLWCGECKAALRIQKISLEAPVARKAKPAP